jgi:DNA-binding NtrC family response regulator
LYLLDDRFPDGYGTERIEPLQAVTPTTPIIIISGDVREANQAQALHLGAQAFLSKPVNVDEVAELIAELIGAAEQNNATNGDYCDQSCGQ